MYERQMQRAMDALARKDIGAIMQPWADDGVAEFAGHSAVSGRYEGREAIEGFFRRILDGLSDIRITVRHVALANPVGLMYSNTIYVESDVDETSLDGTTIHDQRIAVFEWRRGKLVSMREWAFDPEIVEAIWGRGKEH